MRSEVLYNVLTMSHLWNQHLFSFTDKITQLVFSFVLPVYKVTLYVRMVH